MLIFPGYYYADVAVIETGRCRLNIQVLDALGVGLDEGFAGRDFTTH